VRSLRTNLRSQYTCMDPLMMRFVTQPSETPNQVPRTKPRPVLS
jgi:hypothetical protein